MRSGGGSLAGRKQRVAVVGAGIGGLAASIELAAAGCEVEVYESAAEPGGKMRQLPVAGRGVDAGPTVFTMRWIFDELLRAADTALQSELTLHSADVLARHAWCQGGRLDLYADRERSAVAIGDFAGDAEARGYRDFCARSADIYATLREPFIAGQRPGMLDLSWRVGLSRIDALWRTAPWQTLWKALAQHLQDPRLRQLFGRYATYIGSSPLSTPATLMLIAHVEQEGVWFVDGGMRALALALQAVAERCGARFHFGAPVQELAVRGGAVTGLSVDGEARRCDAVVYNGDVSALGTGLLGREAAAAVKAVPPQHRALSAVIFCIVGRVRDFPLHYHTVFFAEDYPEEFHAIFGRGDITRMPTVYVCAQDRAGGALPPGDERLLLLINAPADGDRVGRDAAVLEELRDRALAVLDACGCRIEFDPAHCVTTDPAAFNRRFPASGGSLYGRATHGMNASFQRPGARSRLRRLYLAGGSVHPGAGVPMAAMSGRLAAAALLEDQAR